MGCLYEKRTSVDSLFLCKKEKVYCLPNKKNKCTWAVFMQKRLSVVPKKKNNCRWSVILKKKKV